jgi:hypothetical protein
VVNAEVEGVRVLSVAASTYLHKRSGMSSVSGTKIVCRFHLRSRRHDPQITPALICAGYNFTGGFER